MTAKVSPGPAEDDSSYDNPGEHAEFTRTLYSHRSPLVLGLVGHLLSFGLIYTRVWDTVFLVAGAILVLVLWARLADMKRFDRACQATMNLGQSRMWERRYIAGGAAAATTLGLTCGYSVYAVPDPFASFAAVGITMTSLLSVVGRNFGSPANINVMTAATCIPIMAAMLASFDPYMMAMGLLFVPMFTATRTMALGVRRFLQENIIKNRKIQGLADQFETALNNMPHGLIMLDSDMRVNVVNRKAVSLFEAPGRRFFKGHTLTSALERAVAAGRLEPVAAAAVAGQLDRLVHGDSHMETLAIRPDLLIEASAKVSPGGIVLNFEDVTKRIMQERKVARLARYDTLSGLPNRAHMAEMVEEAVAAMNPGDYVAFSVFDIDGFKHVNDTFGHQAGDEVIRYVGSRLADLGEPRAIVGRLGGDEFVICIPGLSSSENVHPIMDGLYGRITGERAIAGTRMTVSVSGGVVVSRKENFNLDEVLTRADHALYESKRSENVTWSLFNEDMDRQYRDKQALRRDFIAALGAGEISVVYQPMHSPDGGTVGCFEALARWEHPERGFVPPPEFIKIAEENGLVGEVTRQVLDKACRDCATWPGDVSVSVNLSAIDLGSRTILDVIRGALENSGLDPWRLQVEITETMLVDDRESTARILRRIRAMGVQTALDDFGTGYSSLSYLDSLPLNKVKVDRSFVRKVAVERRARDLLHRLVGLCRTIGLEVVVEGVETEAQLDVIRETGEVAWVQGYHFSKPMKPQEVIPYMDSVTAETRRRRVAETGKRFKVVSG